LIDGSAAWPNCLNALVELAGVDACGLLLYECAGGHSQVVAAAGRGFTSERPIQKLAIDEALWRSTPGEIWTAPRGAENGRPDGLQVCGYAVLDRDSAHILYLEFRHRRADRALADSAKRRLENVLPHLHRACRLRRSIVGDDLLRFAAPDRVQPTAPPGLPIELRLRRRFRLSKAEARVATLLADGLAPRMIADRLNVSIHTVRSQLQAIFNKTDTSRQAELTSLILKETEIPRAICHGGAFGAERGERSSCP
jgi:DNA-binding CsgD family transcriptional regulator